MPCGKVRKKRGTVKYCGYVIGRDISPEQVERLFHFLHANYSQFDLVAMRQEQLNQIARDNKSEWW